MHRWLHCILCFVSLALVHGQTSFLPFPTTFPPSFSFEETYRDEVASDPFSPGDFITRPRSTLTITAVGSLDGFDINDTNNLDVFSPFEISIGDFTMRGVLGDDQDYDPVSANHNRSILIPILGFDDNGNEVNAGSMQIVWTLSQVTFTLSVSDSLLYGVDIPLSSVATGDYYPDKNEPNIDRNDLLAKMLFGPFGMDIRSCYVIGSASFQPDSLGRVSENLSTVHLFGAIDSTAPAITITQPTINGILTTNDVTADGKYNIVGTVVDTRFIFGQTLPGAVDTVEVQVGTLTNPGVFVTALLDGAGNWILPNAQIDPGINQVSVRATDVHGNSATTPARAFTYTKKGTISVTCAATGYNPADNGKVAGTVTGSFFVTPGKKLTMTVGQAPLQDSQGGVTAGQIYTVKAKPAAGSVFNGWVGKIKGVTVLNAVTETLNFETKPDLVLIANFVPDPFITTIRGSYNGLITGGSASERGLFNLVLSKSGSFTGSVKIGTVSLPLKGKILGSGFWTTTITKKGGLTYTITLNLTMSVSGDRQINGTVTTTGINSTFAADLNDWHKPKGADPGKVSDAYAGFYNVLLPPALTNADPDFPAGTGFGRVNINKLGTVKFIGKLGDGSPVAASAKLAKRNSGPVVFPIFLPLDKLRGNVSGLVIYDNTQPSSDLTATLDWVEPLTKGTDPDSFTGNVALHGSLYTKPTVGQPIILQTSGGAGKLTLIAPAYTKPITPPASDLALIFNAATLDPAKQIIGPLGLEMVTLKFNSNTGLFTGGYKDTLLNKKIPFFGAASRKANSGTGEAGGVFVRGNRSGAVRFASP